MKKLSFLMIAALFMAACSNNDELLNNENLNGKVIVTAALPSDAPDSRVALEEDDTNPNAPTVKVAWEKEESFSVFHGSEMAVFSKNTEGSVFEGTLPDATSAGDYYAFYPAVDNNGATAVSASALPYDLSEQTGALEAAKTYMYANGGTDGTKYDFNHLTALVKFTLTLPQDATGVTPTKVVISSDKLQPVGTVNLTGTDVVYTKSEDAATVITITPNEDDASLTFYAYVTPMLLNESETNTFVINMDGDDGKYYSGELETSVSIEAQKLYTASVTMEAVVKGSLAMKNGSFKNLSADQISALSSDEKNEVAGIVFWTTADSNTSGTTPATLTYDEIMKKDFPNCTHGLIVSLKDVLQSTKWQSANSNIASWQNSEAFNPENKNDYKSIVSETSATEDESGYINYILGYQNTKILKAYNATLESGSANTVLPVFSLADFSEQNPAPANTTGWFIPSVKELTLLCGKDVDNVWSTDSGAETKGIMNNILTSLGDAYVHTFGSYSYYWSSLERADYADCAFYVAFLRGSVYGQGKGNTFFVRAVCAY